MSEALPGLEDGEATEADAPEQGRSSDSRDRLAVRG